jgi:hypothetical protein
MDPLPTRESDAVAEATARVARYVTFVGYPRSGHSLVGALLDAHPAIVIAHEQDALEQVEAGADRHAIWAAILANSRRYADNGRQWEQYAYAVPGQWNGRFRELHVIGDKKGGRSTLRLADKPGLLDALRTTMQVRCQFIHVIRNPYDNISTIARRGGGGLADASDDYFRRCEHVRAIRARVPAEDWCDVRHEVLVADAAGELRRLCAFLGEACDDAYLRDAAAIVFASPHRSRAEAPWTPALVDAVRVRMGDFAFLRDYAFDR